LKVLQKALSTVLMSAFGIPQFVKVADCYQNISISY